MSVKSLTISLFTVFLMGIGMAQAMVNVSPIHEESITSEQESLMWRKMIAIHGNARAQYILGVIYAQGQGAPQDYYESLKWFRLAAQQGSTLAQLNLGVMYANGQGVIRDYE